MKANGSELTLELTNSLLGELNAIWREREKKQIQRMKLQCKHEIEQMKRKLSHRVPFDEL